MVTPEVAGRRAAEVGVISGDDEVVEQIETEHSYESYLYNYPSVLLAVSPKVFYCLVHLF
jgi:hypothetical protein